MSNLPILRESADEVRIFDPVTGAEIDLAEAPDEQLAELRDLIRDAEEEQRLAKQAIDAEVIARMDRAAKWTLRAGGFEMTAPSPALKNEVVDAAALHAALMVFVDDGLLSVEAVDAAVQQVLTFKPRKAGIDALRKRGGRIAEVIAEHEQQVQPSRRVTLKRAA